MSSIKTKAYYRLTIHIVLLIHCLPQISTLVEANHNNQHDNVFSDSLDDNFEETAGVAAPSADDDDDSIDSVGGSSMMTSSMHKCQPISVPVCKEMAYNDTMMPNILGHGTQEEAGREISQFIPLVKVGCSAHIHLFLCAIYVPVCTILSEPVPPCRSLCVAARHGCDKIMMHFGFQWPPNLDCDHFPRNTSLCIGQMMTDSSTNDVSDASDMASVASGGNADDRALMTSSPTIGIQDGHFVKKTKKYGGARNIGFVCPVQFQVKNMDYTLKVGDKLEKNCGAPCNMMFFTEPQRQFSHVWIGTWAILCSASCLFTVCTFLIDTDRFRYPERPIIFLSVCYLMVALAYVIGFVAGDSISCRDASGFGDPTNANRFWGSAASGVKRVHTIVQGTKYEMCTILFMVLYFFSMASSIWWVVLTLTWFLAAGLKWGHEAIEAHSQYFHLAAWAVPAFKTIVILAMGKVDGDILSGVCYVGLWNVNAMRLFVLTPLCLYLVCGTVFLVSGFVSLFRIRTVMKHDGSRTDKLEKLMIRIGVFSVLYTLPALVVIACLLYEQHNFDRWMVSWNADICRDQTYAVPCPNIPSESSSVTGSNYWFGGAGVTGSTSKWFGSRPIFEVFMIKYLMFMIVGITSSVWIWSGKTMHSWNAFFNRLSLLHTRNINRNSDRNNQAAYV